MFERGLTAPLNGCYFRTITISNFQHLEQCEKNSHGKKIVLNKKPKNQSEVSQADLGLLQRPRWSVL